MTQRRRKGPLAGVPFAVKNLFDVKGLPTRAGSKINRELPPSQHDQPLIERLEAAGAILVGALNMGEYAYDFTGENVHDGPSRNPHDLSRMSGGSSGGSGSAVGGGLVPLALGSDTNGSIRVPSSLVRNFRTEADLRPTVAREVVSLRRQPRSSRTVRALACAISRSPTTPCRAPIRMIRSARIARPSRRRRRLHAESTACASRSPAATSRKAHFRRRSKRSTAWRRRCRSSRRSNFRKRNVHAPRLMSSPRPRARLCISIGCESAPGISIRPCATA